MPVSQSYLTATKKACPMSVWHFRTKVGNTHVLFPLDISIKLATDPVILDCFQIGLSNLGVAKLWKT